MLIHLIKSINWIDLIVLVVFIRIVFVGVQNGFVSEFFKTLGTVVAVFVSLHYYSFLAAWLAQKTGFSWKYWDLLVFVDLWCAVVFFFKFVREGIFYLFKIETNYEGFNKYAAGVVGVAHGILVCSLTLFSFFLIYNGPLTRATLHSLSYKITGSASVNTYSFLYKNLVAKFAAGEHYNVAAPKVLHPDINWSK